MNNKYCPRNSESIHEKQKLMYNGILTQYYKEKEIKLLLI